VSRTTLALNDTIHGFTKHEHDDDALLINTVGRLYDYQLGRFLQVDPLILNPESSQSLNPYSYIGNNPLSGTDPTGYAAEVGCTAATGTHICGFDPGGHGFISTSSGSYTTTDPKTGEKTTTPVTVATNSHGIVSVSSGVGATRSGFVSQGAKGPGGQNTQSVAAAPDAGNPTASSNGVQASNRAVPIDQAGVAQTYPYGTMPSSSSGFRDYMDGLDYALADNQIPFYGRLAWATGDPRYNTKISSEGALRSGQVMSGAAVVGGAAIVLDAINVYAVPPVTAAAKRFWGNLSFDGPDRGFVGYGNGRIAGVRWKGGEYGVRLDFHPLPETNGVSVLHLNFGPAGRGEAAHLILDPHYYGLGN